MREALAAGWRFRLPLLARSGWIAPAGAILAFSAHRCRSVSDIGMGDDGARVVGLQEWLLDPSRSCRAGGCPASLSARALQPGSFATPCGPVSFFRECSWRTTWILTRASRRCGVDALVVAAATGSILPVQVAYGANPDNNPVFAFFVVAATAAVLRGARSDSKRWLAVGCFLLATATWMRYDALPLVPVVGLLLWPRRLRSILFVCASLLPMVFWTVADSLISQKTGNVVGVILQDPSLNMSVTAKAFHQLVRFGTGSPSRLVLGVMGMVRSLKARQAGLDGPASRAWGRAVQPPSS